jgi:death on curing protein
VREPVWLAPEVILAVHNELLAQHGGPGGVRDAGLLDSALARPRNRFAYGACDAAALAAAYAAGIVQNHPFVDGNKRTGFLAGALFLEINGWRLTAEESMAAATTNGLAAGEIEEAEYADWLRTNSTARDA